MCDPVALGAPHGKLLVYIEQVSVLVRSRKDDAILVRALDHVPVGHDCRHIGLSVVAELEKETRSN